MNLEILIKSGHNDEKRKLDLFPDLSFPISYQISTIEDISATKGGISKNITLPDTPHNRELLGYLTDLSVDLGYNYDLGLVNSYNPNLKVPCWVLENSIVISNNASIQITGFDIVNGVNVINAIIYDGNTSLINDIGEMLLTDLDFSEYNFTYSVASVTQSWYNGNDAYKLGYYALLADYGNSRLINAVNNLQRYYLKLNDFFPAVYVKTIWDKIFKTKGYTVDSSFVENNGDPDDRFASLIIPYNKQVLQMDPNFIRDKIYHVGLSSSTIDSPEPKLSSGTIYTSYIGRYIGKTYSGISSYTKSIINMLPGYSDYRSLWYSGYCLNPWKNSSDLNNGSLHPSSLQPQGFTSGYYNMTNTIVPFGLTQAPMYKGTFDTVNNYYIAATSNVYKQSFSLLTDFVTNYSAKYTDGSVDGRPFPYFRGICGVRFYRQYKPSSIIAGSPVDDPGWAGGTGSIIPAYMGDNITNENIYTMCVDENGNMDQLGHWIVDPNGRSNCFTKDGKYIVPNDFTDSYGNSYVRYIGDYYVNDRGTMVAEASDDGTVYYPKVSGCCPAWYNNTDDRYGRWDLSGLWVSGHESPPLVNGYSGTEVQFNYRSAYGDWFQKLLLNTISLDGDSSDRFYGDYGSRMINGNVPIQPGEKVRCVVNFGSYWPGSRFTSTKGAYMPPSVGYLLTNTYFDEMSVYPYGLYQNPATWPEIPYSSYLTGEPLTQFYNTVSTDYIYGSFINFNDLIPKNIKVKDFLKDIIQKHCLYIEPTKDDAKILKIETRDVFFDADTLDWTMKLDISKPINIKLLADTQNKKTIFTYKADNDWYNKQYTQYTNEIYGQQLFISPNQFATSEKKIESIFSPTPLAPIYEIIGLVNPTSISGGFVVPSFVNGSNIGKTVTDVIPNGYIQTNYRILLRNYIENKNGDLLSVFGGVTTSYPYAGPYKDPYSENPYTINWGSTKGEFINRNTSDISNNLINNYWATYLTELQDMDSRLITCYMFLTAVDIHNFSFRNKVRVNINNIDMICKVNSIEDYIPGANLPCKVVLLKSKVVSTPLIFTDSLGNTR